MSARVKMEGQRFGRWIVSNYIGGRRWSCRCDCGAEKVIEGASLRRGTSRGCIKCHTAQGHRRTHGQSKTRLYNIWTGMIERCENKNCEAYDKYGGRGIFICQEWRESFEAFRDWAIANGYQDRLTIDRENNDGHYEPTNCRWATYAQQNRNYSRNRPIEFRGRQVLVCDLALEVGLPQDILKNRIFRYGWSVERAVSEPVAKRERHEPWVAVGMSQSSWYRARAVERRNIDANRPPEPVSAGKAAI